MHILGTNKLQMSLITLFIPLEQKEVAQQTQNIHDKRDRIETKSKKFNQDQGIAALDPRENSTMRNLNKYLNAYNAKLNPVGGFSIVSVTPVLETTTVKVDNDEPMMPLVTTTGVLVILHKEGE